MEFSLSNSPLGNRPDWKCWYFFGVQEFVGLQWKLGTNGVWKLNGLPPEAVILLHQTWGSGMKCIGCCRGLSCFAARWKLSLSVLPGSEAAVVSKGKNINREMTSTAWDSYQWDGFGRGRQLNVLSGITKRISKISFLAVMQFAFPVATVFYCHQRWERGKGPSG